MAYKMKSDFYVPVVLKTLVKYPCSYFSIVKNDHKYPNKMIVCSGRRIWNFIQGIKVANFIGKMNLKINGCL